MTQRRYAAITMVRDEDFFLKIWHDYYAEQFGAENLFVIDHNSQSIRPETIVSPACNVIRIPFDDPIKDPGGENRWFDAERFRFISSQINALLRYYDCVIFNDADEIFVVDTPKGETLREYLDLLPEIGLRSGMGVEVFQDIHSEAAYDPNKPLFEQRKNFRYRFLFCKPWIVAEPRQILGHGAIGGFHLDPNLLLVHLHTVDMDQLLRRRKQRLEAFSEGRGGPLSRWKDDLKMARDQMQNFSEFETMDMDMPHTEMLEEIFPGYRHRLFSSKHYQRVHGKRLRVMEVEKFVTQAQKEMVAFNRFQFPDRFIGKA